MWDIEYTKAAAKSLGTLPANVRTTIQAKIEALAVDPYAPNNNVKRLQGMQDYRLRIGDWRVIYSLYNAALIILVVRIASCGGVYQ